MNTINQAVYDFLDKRQGFYINPHHVEIIFGTEWTPNYPFWNTKWT